MNSVLKIFVLALMIGLSLCGCMRKAESAKQEGAAGTGTVSTPAPGNGQPDAATNPPAASGFDINRVPVVNPQLGRFPYVSLIEGYQPNRSDDNRDAAFDRYEFFVGTKLIPVEGRLQTIAAEGRGASAFQVFKTYESLITSLGGVRVFEGAAEAMKDLGLNFSEARHRHPVFGDDQMGIYLLRTPDKEIWLEAYVSKFNQETYFLTVVEKRALEVKASVLAAEEMKKELDAKGHVALYINFDFDKADIKPESQPIIDEVMELLKANPNLNLVIEGHTDNVGTPDYNRRLSDARARSVVAALTTQGIAARRLSAIGYGQDKPIADNRTDAGRAQNRRVELVKAG